MVVVIKNEKSEMMCNVLMRLFIEISYDVLQSIVVESSVDVKDLPWEIQIELKSSPLNGTHWMLDDHRGLSASKTAK